MFMTATKAAAAVIRTQPEVAETINVMLIALRAASQNLDMAARGDEPGIWKHNAAIVADMLAQLDPAPEFDGD